VFLEERLKVVHEKIDDLREIEDFIVRKMKRQKDKQMVRG
jgi:hypothetical protein